MCTHSLRRARTLHADALAALAPDLILTQDLCRVWALPSQHVEDALDYLSCHAEVVSLDPHTLEEVLASIVTVGERAGVAAQAVALTNSLRARLAAVSSKVAGLDRPKVAVVEWVDRPFTAGHWVPDLVTAAGGRPVAADPGARSMQTEWTPVADSRPDLVLVAPCGFGLASASAQAVAVAERLRGLPVWVMDADAFVVRPGPRLVDGVEAIAGAPHPGAVPPAPAG